MAFSAGGFRFPALHAYGVQPLADRGGRLRFAMQMTDAVLSPGKVKLAKWSSLPRLSGSIDLSYDLERGEFDICTAGHGPAPRQWPAADAVVHAVFSDFPHHLRFLLRDSAPAAKAAEAARSAPEKLAEKRPCDHHQRDCGHGRDGSGQECDHPIVRRQTRGAQVRDLRDHGA